MDMEYSIGPMGLIMKEIGTLTKLKVKELSGMQKEMFIEVNSRMIWRMGMENIHILTEANIKESLEMTYKKDMAKKNG